MTSMTLPVLANEDGLSAYITKVNAFPYLTKDEEFELAKDWAENQNIDAAHKLVTSHLRLVVKIANGFRGYGMPAAELISEGNIGLMQAVKKFDHEKGFRLSTYSMWWIKASIQEYVLKSWSLVKIGTTASQKKLFFNLRKLKNRLKKVDNRSLSEADVKIIADELNVSQSDVYDMDTRLSLTDKSLNTKMNQHADGDQSSEMIDYVESQEPQFDLVLANKNDLDYKRALFLKAMKTLNEREQDIISSRKLAEKATKLEDLSKKYKISSERVRQIESAALIKLQNFVSHATANSNN